MRKRKLRRVCAPESLQRTLQVASLPEVWASGVQRPALECVRMVLGVACGAWSVGNQAMFLVGLDVSQAFMNSPLERPEILRMPLSMSTMKGEPIFLWAEKGIKGLRIASQAWIVFFSSIVKSIGVVSGTV